jgi:hypothetical protein
MKRSPMKPGKPLARAPFPPAEPKPAAGPRQKSCKVCREKFVPVRALQAVCGMACAQKLAEGVRQAQERKQDRERKQALKSRRDWLNEAQQALNAWVRLVRDAGKPCISCGRHHEGQTHGGHYISRGARPNLALVEMNVHLQCAPCNVHLSGNQINFRLGLIARYSVALVEMLESDHTPRKYTVEQLKEIRDTYRRKLREKP